MAFELPALAYPFDALEPHIDATTMEIHHDRHHQDYVDNANAALAGTEWENTPVDELLTQLDKLPADKQGPVRNNAGGHANHTLFWEILGNNGSQPSGDLAAAITREQGKTLGDARGDVFRGLEVVEHACSVGTLTMGETLSNLSAGVDSYSLRQPLVP
jgi:superoxide dismutase